MDLVTVPAPERLTAASLARRGVRLDVVSAGLRHPRVDVTCPASVAPALREALRWRQEAMTRMAEAHPGPVWQQPTLAAVPGTHPRGACLSCGERYPYGDCPLCVAARIATLRALGRIGPATPVRAPAYPAWHWKETAPTERPLRRESPTWWACDKGHDNWGARHLGCGPCEAARFGFMDTSLLWGSRCP